MENKNENNDPNTQPDPDDPTPEAPDEPKAKDDKKASKPSEAKAKDDKKRSKHSDDDEEYKLKTTVHINDGAGRHIFEKSTIAPDELVAKIKRDGTEDRFFYADGEEEAEYELLNNGGVSGFPNSEPPSGRRRRRSQAPSVESGV